LTSFRKSVSVFLILLSAPCLAQQNTDDLFKKIFGKKNKEEKNNLVDVTIGDFFIGEVRINLVGEKITKISQEDLKKILIDKIREESLLKYKLNDGDIAPELLPFPIKYHPSELRVSILIPTEDLRPIDANVYDDLTPYFARQAIAPAPFALALNYKLEQTFNKNTNQSNLFLAQTDLFMNIKNISFDNQMTYFSNNEKYWKRQSSKAIYDRPSRMQRIEAGDAFYPIVGYQQAQSLGGISFYKDFSLNPYRMVTPSSSFEYQVSSRSLVKTYVNNVLLKTEYMNSGSYSVRDIPLNNGINKIVIEIVDDLGVKKILTFNDSGSLDLLAEGVSRYSLATGYPSSEVGRNLKYLNDDGLFATGFYQHGLNRHWTVGGYAQGNKNYKLLGANQIISSRLGNFSYDLAGEKNNFNSGLVTQLTYQLNLFGAYWYDSHTFTTKVEYRSPFFNEVGANFENRYDVTTTASYSVPLFERFNVAIGGSYQNPTLAENSKISYNGSLTTNLFESSSFTAFAGKTKDEFKVWTNQLYFFFNITFGASNSFASAFYDRESKTKRLTVMRDTGKKYNDVKVAAVVDDNITSKNGYLDLQYNSILADIGAREEVVKNNGKKEGYKTSIRLLSSFAYVHNGQDQGFSISRPISNSFVIFKPNEDWKGQKFGVQTFNGVNDASTGIFGETLISELTPYQYRRLQLDPSNLDPGYSLGQESFAVYPKKYSGHLFVVGKSGVLVLKGILIDSENKPLALKVGYWTSATNGKNTPFFTDREGVFFVEGVEASKGSIQIDDEYSPIQMDLTGKKQGLLEIGKIKMINEERLQ
jgi:outer membrane usher protein FimD/PapC